MALQMDILGPVAALVAGLVALIFAAYLIRRIMQMDAGSGEMQELSQHTYEGAMTYLNRQYQVVVVFVAVVALAFLLAGFLTESLSPWIAVSFITGAACSAAAGYIGMGTATRANVRTAQASRNSMGDGLRVAFSSGAVMGMSVVGLGMVGLAITWFWLSFLHPQAAGGVDAVQAVFKQRLDVLAGFGFGASAIALFARVGGGIYTKAADIGADLVGKIESGLPEDDPRNPASIADNVGDNVGDVAGMGADLYESYVNSIIASMVLGGTAAFLAVQATDVSLASMTGTWLAGAGALGVLAAWIMTPLLLRAVGIIAAIVGTFFVRIGEDADAGDCHHAFNRGLTVASLLMVLFGFGFVHMVLGPANYGIFYALVIGIAVGLVLGLLTEYYTSFDYAPTQGIAEQSTTGTATNIISGLATGLESTVGAILTVVAGILGAFYLGEVYTAAPGGGLFGIGIGAIGLLSTLGFSLAVDAYGPVADNAGGIVEMAGLGDDIRERTDKLDSVGNTTAAIGKGFAIGSAAFTALALLSAYVTNVEAAMGTASAGLTMRLTDPLVLAGVFIGSMLPFLVSARTMEAVGRAAGDMIDEVRRQFDATPELLDEDSEIRPDYERCIEISTESALREMAVPSLIAILAPIVVGVLLSPAALGGLLTGAVASGFLMAIFLSNAGGAWDNAKKYIEQDNHGGKGSEAHDAAVVGDTVGDPCKDTSGPSLNILIKLMAVVSLVFAPLFVEFSLLAGV